MTERIGIMGGTFDPIHNGHLVAASEVAHRFGLDQVVFVPTGQPWHKADKKVTAAEHRYIMTTIATAANPQFRVSRVDIDREGPTYTIDTLRDIAQLFPGAELYFITGADALAGIMSWRDWEKMLDMAKFVGVTRPGYALTKDMLPSDAQDSIKLVDIPAMAISSTDCRARAREGAPVWYLVPDGVVQYMAKNNLYQPNENRVLDLN